MTCSFQFFWKLYVQPTDRVSLSSVQATQRNDASSSPGGHEGFRCQLQRNSTRTQTDAHYPRSIHVLRQIERDLCKSCAKNNGHISTFFHKHTHTHTARAYHSFAYDDVGKERANGVLTMFYFALFKRWNEKKGTLRHTDTHTHANDTENAEPRKS